VHPGHQEDVVVDAQGNEEDEHEQGQRGVCAAEPDYLIEQQRADPERCTEGQHDRCHQHHRSDQGAEQQRQDQQHDREHDGDDDPSGRSAATPRMSSPVLRPSTSRPSPH
jgi:hypothetical protein